ncbi:hypothetical protein WJ64_32675 [Burkholderia ubonensis]|nr:hypothetical protein WJ64_32675 [Burkholderia ubonensis]
MDDACVQAFYDGLAGLTETNPGGVAAYMKAFNSAYHIPPFRTVEQQLSVWQESLAWLEANGQGDSILGASIGQLIVAGIGTSAMISQYMRETIMSGGTGPDELQEW